MQSLQYEDAKKHGWTLALHTYSVLTTCQVYNTKMPKKHGLTLALHTYSVLKISGVYNTKVPKIKGGNWRYILTASLKYE